MVASLVPQDVIFGNDPTALINKNSSSDAESLNFLLQNPGINKHPASDAQFCFWVYKSRWNHPHPVFLIADLDSVAGIWTYPAAGDDDRFILMGDMSNNFALPFIPKKSTNDDCTAHYCIM
jgi:hypothetical protein